jgi:ketosteroid isomerase-like protein
MMSRAVTDPSSQTSRQVDWESFVNRLFGCIDNRDWQGLSDILHDEAVYERPGYAPFVGKPAIMDFYLTKRIISRGRHVVEKVLSDGANIACWGSFSGFGKDGANLGARFADVYRIRDGRIDLRRTFFDSPAV